MEDVSLLFRALSDFRPTETTFLLLLIGSRCRQLQVLMTHLLHPEGSLEIWRCQLCVIVAFLHCLMCVRLASELAACSACVDGLLRACGAALPADRWCIEGPVFGPRSSEEEILCLLGGVYVRTGCDDRAAPTWRLWSAGSAPSKIIQNSTTESESLSFCWLVVIHRTKKCDSTFLAWIWRMCFNDLRHKQGMWLSGLLHQRNWLFQPCDCLQRDDPRSRFRKKVDINGNIGWNFVN